MGTNKKNELKTFKLPEFIRAKIKARTKKNGKKMYFYAAELIEAGMRLEDRQNNNQVVNQ